MILNLIERVYAVSTPDADTIASGIEVSQNQTDFPTLITQIISWVLYIAAILAFIYLVISGITFITAGGNAEQAKKGQTGLIYAIIGIIVIALAYVLLTASNNLANSGQLN